MERSLVAGARYHGSLTDIHRSRFTTVQMTHDTHRGRSHIKNRSRYCWRLGRNGRRLDGKISRMCRGGRNGSGCMCRFWGRSWSRCMRGRWNSSHGGSGSERRMVARFDGTTTGNQQEGDRNSAQHNEYSYDRL